MPVQVINPEGLPQPEHYVQMTWPRRSSRRTPMSRPRWPVWARGWPGWPSVAAALGEPDLLVEVEAVAVLA